MGRDIDCLYDEYLDCRKQLQSFVGGLQARRKSLPKRNRQNFAERELDDLLTIQISLGNGMVRDVEYSLELMESYRPAEERPFRDRKINELNLHRQDKRSNDGVNPDGEIIFHSQVEDFSDEVWDDREVISATELLDGLTQRQIDVVLGIYCYEVKSADLAEFFNITRQGVEKNLRLGLNNMANNLELEDDCCIYLDSDTPDKWISEGLLGYLEENFKRKKDFL